MASGTAEVLTPDGDADEERGVELVELYANLYTADGELRTTDEPASPPKRPAVEGGKSLYGTFDEQIRFVGGLSVKGVIRGREIARLQQRQDSARLAGRYVMPRIFPGGR